MSGFLGIGADLGKLKEASPKEYAIRFLFGGGVTLVTGLITHAYGPVVGGLFLAFPAIMPASVTLLHQHEGHKKAGVDALGACIGSVGLLFFGLAIWLLVPLLAGWLAIAIAAAAWLVASTIIWAALRGAKRYSRVIRELPL